MPYGAPLDTERARIMTHVTFLANHPERGPLARSVLASFLSEAFYGISTLLFAANTAVTVVWCSSMSARGGSRMPDGWTMSMAWMRMPGQTWPGAAVSFLGVWVVMMMAMMLPSLSQRCGATAKPSAGRSRRTSVD